MFFSKESETLNENEGKAGWRQETEQKKEEGKQEKRTITIN